MKDLHIIPKDLTKFLRKTKKGKYTIVICIVNLIIFVVINYKPKQIRYCYFIIYTETQFKNDTFVD